MGFPALLLLSIAPFLVCIALVSIARSPLAVRCSIVVHGCPQCECVCSPRWAGTDMGIGEGDAAAET